mmetsp:Transcript_58647/g.70573  ORF Transcript_58647/g.70573 Transcript_58647/m.70573 type:complete len:87 (-) Transcript_58647:426-686(-)
MVTFQRMGARGNKTRYQVKYWAVMTLLKVTKRKVWRNMANDRDLGKAMEVVNRRSACGRNNTVPNRCRNRSSTKKPASRTPAISLP